MKWCAYLPCQWKPGHRRKTQWTVPGHRHLRYWFSKLLQSDEGISRSSITSSWILVNWGSCGKSWVSKVSWKYPDIPPSQNGRSQLSSECARSWEVDSRKSKTAWITINHQQATIARFSLFFMTKLRCFEVACVEQGNTALELKVRIISVLPF